MLEQSLVSRPATEVKTRLGPTGVSSLEIVRTPVPSSIAAEDGLVRITSSVSVGSYWVSPLTVTSMGLLVSPTPNVSIPEA